MAIERVNGVRVNYNTREFHQGLGAPDSDGAVRQLIADFDFANLPAAGLTDDAVTPVLPAGAVPVRAILIVKDAFVGGTSLSVGVGTDLDGLVDVTLTAALGAGAVVVGAGDQVNASLAAAGKVVVTAVGTYTAGSAKLVVDYIVV